MTMLSPLGRVPQRAPRRRHSRRAWPLLVFVLVFAVAAAVVWWRVFSADDADNSAASSCHSQSAKNTGLSLHDVQVRVYNATTVSGLAGRVTRGLQARGLEVVATANDPTHRKVTGVAEIRYGESGTRASKLLAVTFPGGVRVKDRRTDAVVDVALGPSFRDLASPQQIKAAAAKLTTSEPTASASCSSGT